MMRFDATMTIGEARAHLRELVADGHQCPVCTQHAKVYKRKLNSGMAAALLRMWQIGGTDWVHKPTVLKGYGAAARDESLLRFWGLVEEEIERRPDGGRAGYWRVTEHGARFVKGHVTVPSHARVYDGRLLGLVGEPVTIRQALGSKFNYDELMSTSTQAEGALVDKASGAITIPTANSSGADVKTAEVAPDALFDQPAGTTYQAWEAA